MIEPPEGYDLRQVYNDLLFLGVRLKKLEDLVDNIWHIVEGECFNQEVFTSMKMDTRLEEVEAKQEGLMANYAEHLPSIQNAEEHLVKAKQGKKQFGLSSYKDIK